MTAMPLCQTSVELFTKECLRPKVQKADSWGTVVKYLVFRRLPFYAGNYLMIIRLFIASTCGEIAGRPAIDGEWGYELGRRQSL